MTTNQDSPWKSTFPEAVGLYIAATTRRADSVRFWTGKHWTAPTMVRDLHLPGRTPQVDWPAAQTHGGRPIEWLEPVTLDAEGFISWGGQINESPVPAGAMATVRLRNGERASGVISNDWRWRHDGRASDIVAYRVVDCDLAPANEEPVERREAAGGRRATDGAGESTSGSVRSFSTGATRSADTGRYDPEAFLAPIVIERFCEYMNKHRLQPDGTLRAGDNWQKGIPPETYLKGAWRHMLHLWTRRRGFEVQDPLATAGVEEDLCAIMFNIQGLLFELLKDERRAKVAA